jgi:hydroxyversicolorone monooxygenase
VRHTVWTEDCRSWYKNNETGRVNAVWPGSSLHYIEAIRQIRYEDYDVRYLGVGRKNRFAYLGMGTTEALVLKGDPSPYLNVGMIDPDWMRAMGMDEGKIHDAKIRDLEAKREEQEGRSKENVEATSIV